MTGQFNCGSPLKANPLIRNSCANMPVNGRGSLDRIQVNLFEIYLERGLHWSFTPLSMSHWNQLRFASSIARTHAF
jgi:hypothetical protein